ncbi:hypothetical protein DB35_06045 [Streptomyces abyssalis]|uniref:Uncharacterized protein n=1 Tax=Streptomyces abyssalis TaxID=933944 RepID=A0A1E7JTB3_9ACTN|nr:hypothetical protein AN215_06700 [Streptomyces abyssalis]OEU94614.1 hypothetical protein DB35_06045 [Streptomyces abyssalis]
MHLARTPLGGDGAFGLRQHGLAQPGTLQVGTDREHPEVGSLAAPFQLAAGHETALPLDGQHDAAVTGDDGADALGVGALAFQQVGLGRPACTAGVAPVGRLQERDESVYVLPPGDTEAQLTGLLDVGLLDVLHGRRP